jgi:hypothetical protein
MPIDLAGGDEMLLLSLGPLTGRRLPGDWVLPEPFRRDTSGWATVTVVEQRLTQRADGTLIRAIGGTDSLLRALTRVTAAPKMTTSNMFHLKDSSPACDVRAVRVVSSNLPVCGWDTIVRVSNPRPAVAFVNCVYTIK